MAYLACDRKIRCAELPHQADHVIQIAELARCGAITKAATKLLIEQLTLAVAFQIKVFVQFNTLFIVVGDTQFTFAVGESNTCATDQQRTL